MESGLVVSVSGREAFYSLIICYQGNLINYWIKLEASTELHIPASEQCYKGIYHTYDYQPLDLQEYSRKMEIRQFFLVFDRRGKRTLTALSLSGTQYYALTLRSACNYF